MTPTPMPPLTTMTMPGRGPEDVEIGADGQLYTALNGTGELLRIDPETQAHKVVAKLGGKPLGVERMPNGNLMICNGDLGPQVYDPSTGEAWSLGTLIGDKPYTICNNAAITSDGTAYVTESSQKFQLAEHGRDLAEHTCTGRLTRFRPGEPAEVLMEGLAFANGVALSPAQDYVYVAETGRQKVHRVSVADGTIEPFVDTPGHPDNMALGTDGLLWIAIPSLPNPALAGGEAPAEGVPPCCRVVAYDGHGKMVYLFDGDPKEMRLVTGLREHHGRVYMGSIYGDRIAWFDLPKA